MPFKKSLGIFFVVIASVTATLGLTLINRQLLPDKNEPYPKLWKRVDSCESKGLTESALKIVTGIYTRAKSENNAQQFVKAVIYKMKFAQYKEEFSQEKNINELAEETAQAKFPVKPVLHSILADAYWQYYQANRWKFYNRSQTVSFDKNDIATYDLKALVNAAVVNYRASLHDSVLLKQTKINLFEEVIIPGTTSARQWRPTLYDFLAHRALDFFKNSEADVTKAANQFAINEDEYLKPYPAFLKLKVAHPQDSLDLSYYAVKLFQDLLSFQVKTNNRDGLVDLEIERLEFTYANSKNQFKDSLYLETIKEMAQRFENNSRAGEIRHMEAQWWLSKSSEYRALESDRYKWNRKKALEICDEIIKKYPRSRGAQMATNTANSIRVKNVSLTAEQVNEPQQPNRVLIHYTNVSKVYFRLVKTDYFEYQKLLRRQYEKDFVSKILALPSIQAFEQKLPDDPDFNPHAVEAKVPPLDHGYYVLVASDSPQFSMKEGVINCQLYVVSDLAYINKNKTTGGYDFYLLNRQTGKPVKQATAQVLFNTYNYKSNTYEFTKGKSYVTDDEGHFDLEGDERNPNSFFVEFTSGKDKLISDGNFYNYRDYENSTGDTRSFIFTDRAIYRPGQTIYFKAIVLKSLKNRSEVLATHPVTITFYDVNHQKISSQDLVTNDYGTVSGSFTAPQGVLTGQMQITDGYGSVSISVEEYKRPKFETRFDTLKGSYKINEQVSVRGFAKAYAGNNIDDAEVKYRVLRRINYSDWWYWYRPFQNTSTSEVEISNGALKTDEQGYFEIKFTALPDPTADKKDNPVYTYQVMADVTDMNGETRSAQVDFRVGYKALELNFSSPEIVNVKDLPKMSVTAMNLNGIEEFVKGQLTVYELTQPQKIFRKRLWEQPDKHVFNREEYYKLFPHDLYEDETNQYKWKKNKKVFARSFDTRTDKNIVVNEFKNLQPGVYLVEGLSTDKTGEEIKSLNYITVFDPGSAELPFKTPQWSYDIKQTAEPGETASFILASSYSDVNCVYEVESTARRERKFISPSLRPLEINVTEEDRGGISTTTHFIKHGRIYSSAHYVTVPFSNKELVIEYATFRNKLLPGQQEEWTLTVKSKKGDKVAAEMLATLYDASLDAFRPNAWSFNIYNSFYPRATWMHSLEDVVQSFPTGNYRSEYVSVDPLSYDRLNYFGMSDYGWGNGSYRRFKSTAKNSVAYTADGAELEESISAQAGVAAPQAATYAWSSDADSSSKKSGRGTERMPGVKDTEQTPPQARKNFNETAFFFPQLRTNEKGEVIIKFTIPESLTKWKFMGFAHTKDLSYGQTQNEVLTQKELMVVPNAPRFFRENDKMTFVSKISNLSLNELSGSAEIKFYDAFTEKEISEKLLITNTKPQSFNLKKGASAAVEWEIVVPEGLQAIKYKVTARAGNFSDGEEMVVPVLTNRMLVTESMPLPIRGKQTKEFNFGKFISQNNNSATLRNHAYTLEFTANPAWYAVQSLPYLMEYPYECAEQVFARYYANALASHIANSKPKIRQIFDAWKSSSPESFLSNLEKNQELKSLLLEETPWVMAAKSESENKKRVALLFDMNKMAGELNAAVIKLESMQTFNGGWPWFKGCPEDWYISQHIVTGFAHLQKLGVINIENDPRISQMVNKALAFCDQQLQRHYLTLKQLNKNYEKENHLDPICIQYLYMRSYFKDAPGVNKEQLAYYKKQAQTYWLSNSRYTQAMIALALNRYEDKKTATDILRSLKENALVSEEMGMYWKENYGGYYWYQAPIEMQAMMIEAFDEVANDLKSVDDLKTWLIKSKQTQHWGTTRATTEAVYALLLRGSDWLATEPNVEISLGPVLLDPKNDPEIKAEAGTGYFKKTFSGSDIKPAMGKVKVVKKDQGVSWGAVYWQYFEQLDKITPHETPLKLNKKLFVETNTASGPVIVPVTEAVKLKRGDKIKVRIELRADRDMEYIHLKDMRAAGFEPMNVFSAYRYQDGLGYYESTKDAATNFFISYLPKGTYVFEYPVLITHAGDFSNGISSIQCMYAPEFTSHSEGIRVKTGK
ncbi:MAG: alpha-2-macroglobulin family protein [Bacteroidota bacterium]